MFAFQSMFDVAGAGPAEKREKDESPINWGHSNFSKLSLLPAPVKFEVEAAALTRLLFDTAKKLDVKTIEITIIAVIMILVFAIFSPQSSFLIKA
jgi:hypothetical protein